MTEPEITFANASYGFRDYGLKEYFETTKRIGISAVEIDAGWLIGSKNAISPDASAEEIERVSQLASNSGVKIAVLGAGAVLHLNGDQIEAQIGTLKKVMDIAEVLDVRVIRVFAEHDFHESQHYVLPPERVTDALYGSLSDALNELAEYAHGKNVVLGIETHGGTSATGSRMRKLLDMVPRKEIGVTYDPANLAFSGDDPYEALLQFEDRVVYTHWKDCVRVDGTNANCAFGEGHIDWVPIVDTLLGSFDGLWAIEYEIKEHSTIETLADGTTRSVNNLQRVANGILKSRSND